MNEKKILLLIPNLGRGGAQQVFRDQLQFYSIQYHTLGCVFNFDDSFKDDERANILSLDVPAGKNFLSKIACFFKRIVALRKIKRKYNVTYCISHLEGADYVNLLSKRKEKIICWIHGSKVFDENIEGTLGFFRKKILIPLTYRLSNKIITVSNGIRMELVKHFGIPQKKITTIYNSFNLEDIFEKAKQSVDSSYQELFANESVLITHCRLSRQKNLFALIDIFISTKSQYATKLMILGDGELREEILQYCTTHNLRIYSVWEKDLPFHSGYDIYFLGYERNPYPFLSRAALYVMTSSWEGFPLSLCEAIASGVPVISSDCYTGPREIISPRLETAQPINEPLIATYGILMPLASNETAKAWSDTIISTLRNIPLQQDLIKNGKERVSAFDRKVISEQWLKLIEQTRE